ncbi:MAG: WG repeat-containing protein [Candidatus Symbiothrix sp.]|jgi:hypothetical protein|nr:WG repeat-containing protein [Candidatus Symbiothrix sp.]
METILKLQQDEKGKYGFVDSTGKVVIPFKYDNAEEFINGWAEVIIDGHWGIINRKNPSQLADFDEFIKNE